MKKRYFLFLMILLVPTATAYADTLYIQLANGLIGMNDSLLWGTNISCNDVVGASYDVCTGGGTGSGGYWTLDDYWIQNVSSVATFNETLLNNTITARAELTDTDTTYSENSLYIILTGTVFGFNETRLNSTVDTRIGVQADNHTVDIAVGGTTTKTLNLDLKNGDNLTASWTDIDTDTDTTIGNCTNQYSCDYLLYAGNTTFLQSFDTNTWNTTEDMVTGANSTGYLIDWSTSIIDTDTTIGNCSVDGSCPEIMYYSNLTSIDTNTWNTTEDMVTGANSTGYLIDWSTIISLTDTDTLYVLDEIYLNNISGTATLNETLLNATINDIVGEMGGGTVTSASGDGYYVLGTITTSGSFTFNETNLNNTITARAELTDTDTNTWNTTEDMVAGANSTGYLIDWSTSIIDTDTTIGNCSVDGSCDNIVYASNFTGLSDNYVNVSGDTMTGDLALGGNDVIANGINVSYIYSKNSQTGADIRADPWYFSTTIEVQSGSDFCISEGDCLSTVDTDTTIGNCSVDGSCPEIMYYSNLTSIDTNTWNTTEDMVTGANSTGYLIDWSTAIVDTDTLWQTTSYWLYNNSDTLTFNESKLNSTITTRAELTDTDTTYTENSPYLTLATTVFGFDESLLNTTIDARSDFDTDTTIGNCTVDQSCDNVVYDADTSLWDKDTSNDFNTTTALAGEVTGVYSSTVLNHDALDDQYIELGDTFGGEVTGTYGAINVSDDLTVVDVNVTNRIELGTMCIRYNATDIIIGGC